MNGSKAGDWNDDFTHADYRSQYVIDFGEIIPIACGPSWSYQLLQLIPLFSGPFAWYFLAIISCLGVCVKCMAESKIKSSVKTLAKPSGHQLAHNLRE